MGQVLSIELTDMAHGGEAVGRHEGKVIFVPYAIAGETVRVEVVRDRGRFAHARLLDVLHPAPQRVQPPCPYFGACGGCHWQHLAYEAQLDYKRSIVQSQLQRIAGLPDVLVRPPVGMGKPWRYRNHVQFSVSDEGQLGFMAANSHRIIPIESCLLMHPLLSELFECLDIELPGLRRLSLRAGINTGERMLVFEMVSDEAPAIEVDLPISCVLLVGDGTPVTLLGSPYIHERLTSRTYRVSASSFFQVNTSQAEALVAQVCAYLNAGPADTVLDAYCGVGTFTAALAERAQAVIGIESSPAGIADAMANGTGLGNVRFMQGAVEEVLPALDARGSLVVLDPPREGVGQEALVALIKLSPPRIVYVSCDPATLARDVKAMVAASYALREVQPIDMFPQTYHIESVALLERR